MEEWRGESGALRKGRVARREVGSMVVEVVVEVVVVRCLSYMSGVVVVCVRRWMYEYGCIKFQKVPIGEVGLRWPSSF